MTEPQAAPRPEPSRLCSIEIDGYKPFRDFKADLGPLEVIVGANGSGKSSLFEFLRFLRDGMESEIPLGIVPNYKGETVFHKPGVEEIRWRLRVKNFLFGSGVSYRGHITGSINRVRIASEEVVTTSGKESMRIEQGKGEIFDWKALEDDGSEIREYNKRPIVVAKSQQLALGTMRNGATYSLYSLREYISQWRFYSSFHINDDTIRRSALAEQNPELREDCGNLSAVIFWLIAEHEQLFKDMQVHLRSVVPGFKALKVKPYGAPGQVMVFWQEQGVDYDLSLADLSDGTIRLLCWITLCVVPNPPPLICIDEPDQFVHPRTLPILAALFKKASTHTQIILSSHSSYFLTQFDLDEIAVMRKRNGVSEFFKPKDSEVLMSLLDEFGIRDVEFMHRNDELERLV